ncbi:MAG: hypothetical protein US86_C0003G0080 [Candidatus Daviesbacteria bacterium GW2011_GWA2_38_24]|uniref:DUF5659 domain-containing protein n=1 Tax=Candidatus Daviesbacteria bacterium GW2011_GWA2_38_24 TaxID=1618422 RepID=A0A0G0JJ47_9BACT|nr:MAG: hypothetical protein US86_C0003G0080 [Candidatus Daviesbacteria bacterium GW2011_GWA2_38_24]KKQ80222.1 MAG: hypothetical protein UT01_C0016G0003 [Candidatus Daviesbacteria bacterium GW2011_GWA1_38_7]OGE24632.1 MAG: hypothetical protein A2688_00440 [Candidatus Daviesbacteria bacterium RIFCSPHIGHO2_01_FULL_38_8]
MEIGYRTKNLHISAYLYASNLQLLRSEWVDNEVFFEFTPKEQAEKLVENYFVGVAQVDPRELFARLKDLKDLIFSGGTHE